MPRKYYWRLGILAILIIGMALALLIRPTNTTSRDVYKDVDPAKEVVDPMRQDVSKKKPPIARPGYKIVFHAGHYHEVPIDAPDAEQEEPTPIAQDAPAVKVPKTYDGPLTYHAELLETNPVKALRLQAEERGHWSKDHIPPFPLDDAVAQAFAKNIYLMHYYESIDDESNSVYGDAVRACMSQIQASDEYEGARSRDLWRLSWTRTNAGEITPYGGFVPGLGRPRMFDSDYFPDFIDVPADNILDRIRELEKMQRAE